MQPCLGLKVGKHPSEFLQAIFPALLLPKQIYVHEANNLSRRIQNVLNVAINQVEGNDKAN